MSDEIIQARREVQRCQIALDKGSPREFWLARLDRAAKRFEAAAAVLRMQIAAMTAPSLPARKRGAGR